MNFWVSRIGQILALRRDRVPPPAAAWIWIAVIGLHWALAICLRPLTPVDETRYVTVAWEMWQRGDFLVPHLNGLPYSHKPPVLFWAIHAGWALFGVSELWARLVPALFAVAATLAARSLAAALWPDRPAVAERVPWLLLAGLPWGLLGTIVGFDMALTAFCLLALRGVVVAAAGEWRGWCVFSLATGAALLTKGPVALLVVVPVALLAPWWRRWGRPASWWSWYAGFSVALAVAIGVALAWAVPASESAGPLFREGIFRAQTTGRLIASFAHRHPWWWYLPFLPLLVFPLSLWPPLWRVLLRRRPLNDGQRFCVAWALPALVAMSAVSGKQPYYLLPIVPAFALAVAALLEGTAEKPERRDFWPLAAALGLLAAALFAMSFRWVHLHLGGAPNLLPAAALAALSAVFVGLRQPHPPLQSPPRLAGIGLIFLLLLHVGFQQAIGASFDLSEFSRRLGVYQEQGYELAVVDNYHGQFGFLGRLLRPVSVLRPEEVLPWSRAHPNGVVVREYRSGLLAGLPEPLLEQGYRERRLGAWLARELQ